MFRTAFNRAYFTFSFTRVMLSIVLVICSSTAANADYTSPSPAAGDQYGINYKEALQQADSFSQPSLVPKYGTLGGIGSSALQTTSATASDSSQVPARQRFSPAVESEPPSSPAFTIMGGNGVAGNETFSTRLSQSPVAPPEIGLRNFGGSATPAATTTPTLGNFGFSSPLDPYGRTEHGGGFLRLDFENSIRMNR